MNIEKLKKLQESVRIGGKGTPRRKKKIVHQTAATDDKKLQSSLKKLSVNTIPGIEEVNMIRDDGTIIHFNNPKAQASLAANTFAITGHGEHKQVRDSGNCIGECVFGARHKETMLLWRLCEAGSCSAGVHRDGRVIYVDAGFLSREMPSHNLTSLATHRRIVM